MRDLLNLIRWLLLGLVRSRRSLEAENLALRHQLTVLHRSAPKRPTLRNFDRLVFVCLYRIAPLCIPQIPSAWPEGPNRAIILPMRALLNLIRWMLLGLDLDRGRERSPASSAKRAVSECYEAPCPQNV